MIDSKRDVLNKEVQLGDKAEKAYKLWLMHYLDTQFALLIDDFKNCDIEDTHNLWYKVQALSEIESAVKIDIETGSAAASELVRG